LLQQTVNTLTAAAIYALFAMGYALVFRILDILNLAHAAIFMIGAFSALQAVLSWHWPLFLALPFGMLVGGVT
jgi:branched-chain amino acid transport system permease protein